MVTHTQTEPRSPLPRVQLKHSAKRYVRVAMTRRLFIAPLAVLLAAAAARGLEVRSECENHASTKTPLCSELFQSLQAALVQSETDLYNLRKIFFPSSDVSPTLINTSYELVFENVPDIPCPDAGENATLLNTSATIYRSYGWTSKVFYTLFHPATLNRLQPQLFYTMMTVFESKTSRTVETAFYWEGVDPYLTLQLFLVVRGLSCTPSYEQLDNTLKDVTSVLKFYAQHQTNITTWKSSDSYVLDRRVFTTDWWRHEYQVYGISSHLRLINFIVALVVTISLTFVFIGILSKVKDDQKNLPLYQSALWTSTGVLLLLCIALYITEIVKVGIWWHHSAGEELAINIIWFLLSLLCAISTCVYTLTLKDDKHVLDYSNAIWPGLLLGVRLDALFCCCSDCDFFGCGKKCKKVPRFLPIVVFFLSAGYITINIIPVTLYFLIYPYRVLAFYSFVATVLTLQTLALTTVDMVRRWEDKEKDHDKDDFDKWECLRKYFSFYAPFLSTVFIALLTILFVSIYRTLVSGEATGNALLRIIKALVPPLLVSSPMVWIVKKMKQYRNALQQDYNLFETQ